MRKTGKRSASSEVLAKRSEASRANLYSEITDRIIADLERGCVPWVKAWGSAKAALGLPKNAAGRTYSGINILILWGAVIENGYPGQHWLTFRQALSLGGNVRKGEHGTTIVHADRFIPKTEKERAREEDIEPQAVPFLKRFAVFNVAQCEGLPDEFYSQPEPLPEREIIPQARGAHSGFALARDLSGSFGTKAYAREELTAEITAAFVCSSLGIEPTVRHADYIASWLAVLREENRAIFRAASLASKAADFLLAFQANGETEAQQGIAA
ncbi:ArdC-like ssDNA-binding domain-containing protein [Mesorhizobium australicum]|uniref:ArdC family protein n=1 Tax=Mesorhizobium australicum TaxID=536018 RepID=UPI003338385F